VSSADGVLTRHTSPSAVCLRTGNGRIVQFAFSTIHLLDEDPTIGERDTILLEDLTGDPSTEHRARTVLIQVANSRIDPDPQG
jgi:hypothetical protein